MGETSRVYFIPIHEEEKERGITPTPHPNERPTVGVTAWMERRASAHCALALISIRGIVRTGWREGKCYIPRMAHPCGIQLPRHSVASVSFSTRGGAGAGGLGGWVGGWEGHNGKGVPSLPLSYDAHSLALSSAPNHSFLGLAPF